jgi:hypothetical protein
MMHTIVARFAVFCVSVVLLGACQTGATSFGSAKLSGARTIVLMPVDIELGELQAGGMVEPKADWTDNGRVYLMHAIDGMVNGGPTKLVIANPELVLDDPTSIEAQLIDLHGAVGGSITYHNPKGGMGLPSKGETFDWTLGPDVTILRQRYGADYALFVRVRDQYTSAGRVAATVIAAAIFRTHLAKATQSGFASLVDLSTGNVLWFNALSRETGDLRHQKGADDTATVLLTNFPK